MEYFDKVSKQCRIFDYDTLSGRILRTDTDTGRPFESTPRAQHVSRMMWTML